MVGNYTSTYGFVGHLKLEEVADKVLGKGWEAEDDVFQIQSICDEISPDKYSVCSIEGLRRDDDIEVRFTDNYDEVKQLKNKLNWYNLFVDYVQETDINLYNYACEYADNSEVELTENGLTAEEVATFYVGNGIIDFEKKPFNSFSPSDWIKLGNTNNLEI